MTTKQFSGVGTALVTPFQKGGALDLSRMKTLVERQVENGIDMLIPCGTTGEAVTLSNDEYERVIATVVEISAGRKTVIAGAGSNSTERTIQTARIAQACGADALLVVGPYYNKPTAEGFYQHFKAVAEAIPLPIVMYNVPGRTGSNISAETQLRIAQIENVVAVKEASANFSQVMHIIENKPDDFAVLSGDDNLALAQISLGMDGVISVVSNEIPKEFSDLVHAALDGRFDKAREAQYHLLALMEINFIESNPIPVKAAMAMMGLIEEVYRLPLVPMTEEKKEKLREVLVSLALLP